ncbi:hypothetical protein TNCV_18661 [Trichonephila clavipes]|nr:hypothetical protein TNCV_18661 [Trichonephila clavipes]
MESIKGGGALVIRQKPGTAFPLTTPRIQRHSTRAKIQWANPSPPSTAPTPHQCLPEDTEVTPPANRQERAHSCLPPTVKRWPKGKQKTSPGHPHGRHTQQTCGPGNQWCQSKI